MISVLYVDDEPGLLELGKIFLEQEGLFAVDTLTSATEALARLKTVRYDAIVSDYQMPEIDGITFLKRIKETGDTTPFIIFTGRGREQIVIEALNNGADFYLQKGGDPMSQFAELSNKIRYAVTRKRAESDVQAEKERFKLFFNTIPNAAMIVRLTDGIIIDVNDAFLTLSGFSRNEAVGRTIADISIWLQDDEREKLVREIKKHGFCNNLEVNFRLKDGTPIIGMVSGKIIHIGGLPHIITVTHDITDARRTKDALYSANAKLQLLSGITRHDINNQITSLIGYCGLLEIACQDNPKALDYVRQIKNSSGKILQTITFTKDYEQLGLNAPLWQDIEKIVQVAAVDLLPQQVNLVVNTGRYEIFADPMLMLVFYNLLENSVRHGVRVTEIAVHFIEHENTGTLVVTDNGAGIPERLKKKIFEKGFGSNTGFGLFLIREILAITGISIQETGTEGRGARFEIHLPPGTWRRSSERPARCDYVSVMPG